MQQEQGNQTENKVSDAQKEADNEDTSCLHFRQICFSLSAGNRHDAPQGRKLLDTIYSEEEQYLLMDRAYEDDKTRSLAVENGFIPVVPPKRNRKELWDYDKELYKQRNEVERFFLRLKRFRKAFTRYDKLDRHYMSVIYLAMIFDAILM